MVNTNVAIDLSNKIQNLKTINKKEYLNTENKSDFKECLSKEFNLKIEDNTKIESKELNNDKSIGEKSNDENKLNSDELASEISEKIEEILNNKDFEIDSDDEVLEEIVSLLINFIEVNLKDFSTNNNININEANKINLDINDINFSEFNDNKFSKLFEDKSSILKLNEEISLDDSKYILKNIKNLLEEYINYSDNNIVLKDFNTVDEVKSNLLDEIKNLIDIIPSSSIENIQDKLNSDVTKEILNTLVLNTNNDLEPKNSIKDNTQKNDINEDIITNIETNKEKSEFKIDSQETNNEENLNKENSSKDSIINKKEEDILMKFLEDDSTKSFSKSLNYYDKLNKINSTVEIIKEPIAINKETINLDIIKNVKYMIRNSVEELNVKIYPKELGEMTIKILSEEGIMKAEIKATSKETYNLLNSNINEIKKTLENQNLRIQEVNIGIYNEDTTFFSGKENSRENFREFNNKNERNLIYEEDDISEDLLIDNNVNFLV